MFQGILHTSPPCSYFRLHERLIGRLAHLLQTESHLSATNYAVLVNLTDVPDGYKGIYYDALPADGPEYTEDTVAVIGEGDTAGRAVDTFASCGAAKVHLIIRSTFADAPMLEAIKKLVMDREEAQRCRIWEETEVEQYKGDTYLDQLVLGINKKSGKPKTETVDATPPSC
ncbi:hypothetical protein [Streptomyces zagrosensis]|uniref:hypothetical protein n=1 Tax=Streptomyces zagrosensis TaxID=1042984 RepID=UPI0028AC02CF|nr:hypothetical protein [Streptomyces zagrosensis]